MGSRGKRMWAGIASVLALGLMTSVLGSSAASAAPGDPAFTTAGVPAISGTAKVGATLTATPGTWDPEPTAVAYQWLRDGMVVDAAVDDEYLPTAADIGHALSVQVTASAEGREDGVATSAATAKVVPGTLAYATPKISGTLAIGATITAVKTGWTEGTTFTHQWYADGRAISKATGETFKLTTYQHAKRISVKVIGRLAGYTAVSRTSAQTAKVMRAGYAKVIGTPAVGTTLTSSRGTWTSSVTFSYRWLRDGADISGATRSTYKLTSADAGKQVSVRITGKRYGYASVVRTSPATAKVTSAVTPKISGSAVVGSTLTLIPGTWSEGTTLTYQWLRSGYTISGAVAETYKVASADDGKQLSVRVTGKQAGWATVVKTSAKTLKVMKAGTPSISGTPNPGYTLTARVGSWSSYTSFSYQWKRNGSAISGATRSTYKLTSWDAGKQVTVTVTGRKSGYTTVSKTSAAVTVTFSSMRYYRVGVDIKAGTYRATGGGLCYWERRYNNWGWEDEATIASGPWHAAVVLVEIHDGEYLWVENCGNWSPVTLGAPGRSLTTFGTGDWLVGTDVAPGTYATSGGLHCGWWRLDAAGLELEDSDAGVGGVLGMGLQHGGQNIVTIAPTDTVFISANCGTWVPLSSTPVLRSSVGNGDYGVGIHVQSGIWQSTTFDPEYCYVEIGYGFAGDYDELSFWGGPEDGATQIQIGLFDDDVRFSTRDCGTWVRVGDIPPPAAARVTQESSTRSTGIEPTASRSNQRSEDAVVASPTR